MTAPAASNPATTFATTIGRYFSIVSVVPSLVLVTFILVLVRSGAWNHGPDFAAGVNALTQAGLGGAFALVLAALALGVVLHPLQYALVQFLEGYWGTGPFWQALRKNRIRHHMWRRNKLGLRVADEAEALGLVDGGGASKVDLDDWEAAVHTAEKVAAERLLAIYPRDEAHIMPTRLGNVLRAAETNAGFAIGLDIIDFGPHLMMVARREHVDYVNDQRTAMDLAARSCLVCLLGFLAAVIFLFPHGLWLLVSLIPLVLSWLCYQGAITAAQEYGESLRMLVDLNRFALYAELHLPLPSSTPAERETVADIRKLSSEPKKTAFLLYRHTDGAEGSGNDQQRKGK
jgi:hypothetical protein